MEAEEILRDDVKIKINTIDKVKRFVELAIKFPGDVDIVSGRYVVDGKSIMGVFSLDVTKTLKVIVEHECGDIIAEFIRQLIDSKLTYEEM